MLIYSLELGFKKRNKAYYYFINNIVVTKKHAYSFIKKFFEDHLELWVINCLWKGLDTLTLNHIPVMYSDGA